MLKARNLTKIYPSENACGRCELHTDINSNICKMCGSVVACYDASFDLAENETLAIVGESGSGKSTLLQMLNFDVYPTSGSVYFDYYKNGSSDIYAANSEERRMIKTLGLGIVYQNPRQGLNFDISVGGNIAERLLMAGWRNYSRAHDVVGTLMDSTEIPHARMKDMPESFSGGMQQRVQISKALANNPKLILLDEPTTGLDVSVQARILDLIRKLQKKMRFSVLLVSHDLGVVRLLAQRCLVMKSGRVVESGLTDQILEDPQHEYTQLLVNCTLQ